MTIEDPVLASHYAALAFYESQMLKLYREKDKYHPTQYFAMMADPLVEHIKRERAAIDEYIGVSDFDRGAAAHEAARAANGAAKGAHADASTDGVAAGP